MRSRSQLDERRPRRRRPEGSNPPRAPTQRDRTPPEPCLAPGRFGPSGRARPLCSPSSLSAHELRSSSQVATAQTPNGSRARNEDDGWRARARGGAGWWWRTGMGGVHGTAGDKACGGVEEVVPGLGGAGRRRGMPCLRVEGGRHGLHISGLWTRRNLAPDLPGDGDHSTQHVLAARTANQGVLGWWGDVGRQPGLTSSGTVASEVTRDNLGPRTRVGHGAQWTSTPQAGPFPSPACSCRPSHWQLSVAPRDGQGRRLEDGTLFPPLPRRVIRVVGGLESSLRWRRWPERDHEQGGDPGRWTLLGGVGTN